MRIFLDKDGLVSALKKVTGSAASVVEELCVYAVQLAHAEGEVAIRSFDQEMVVVIHETIGVAKPIVPLINMLESSQKVLTVLIVLEHGFLFIAA